MNNMISYCVVISHFKVLAAYSNMSAGPSSGSVTVSYSASPQAIQGCSDKFEIMVY